MHVDIWWNMWLLLNKTAKCLYLLVTLIANMFLIYFDDRKLKSSFCPIVHYNRHVVIGYLHSYRWPLLWHYIPEQYPFQKLLLWHIVKVRTHKMKMLQMPHLIKLIYFITVLLNSPMFKIPLKCLYFTCNIYR